MTDLLYLKLAGQYAKEKTGCTKVSVGSCIVKNDTVISMGANRAVPNLCKSAGCLRVAKYGENSKAHRNPDDCRAIHSEVDAIGKACKNGVNLSGATIYVTRYPCEACARLIIASGITRIVYGRHQHPSPMTLHMLESEGVACINCQEYEEEDTND